MADSNYRACLKEILKHEGGYVNHPRDPGGETNFGITKATAQANGYHGSMRSIPMEVVEQIYRTKFWKSSSGDCDRLIVGVDLATFDFAVNSGPSRAWKYLKAALGGNAIDTIKSLCAKRMGFLRALGTWGTFGKGWTKRVANVEAVAVKMVLQAANLHPEVVQKKLDQESKDAKGKSDKSLKGAGAATGGEVAKDAGATQIDVSAFDWPQWLVFGAISVGLVLLALFLIGKWQQHKERAAAYAVAAKEV